MGPSARVCPWCGTDNDPNHQFCLQCRRRLPTRSDELRRLGTPRDGGPVRWTRRPRWGAIGLAAVGLLAVVAGLALHTSPSPPSGACYVGGPPCETVLASSLLQDQFAVGLAVSGFWALCWGLCFHQRWVAEPPSDASRLR